MFAPIPVIHETHLYVNPLCLFFPFAQWTLWRTVMIHRLFFHSFCWIKTDRRRQGFSVQYNFHTLLLAPNFMFKLPGGRNVSIKCTEITGVLISP
jgi:hypothetical protein